MVATRGLVGLRPAVAHAARTTCPPYDVIKEASPLWRRLEATSESLFHVTLGNDPVGALQRLVSEGVLVEDTEAAFYVYEQSWGGTSRTGVFVAAEVTPYAKREVIRHEKTFDDKVQGRIALSRNTGHTIGPVFLLTQEPAASGGLGAVLNDAKSGTPLYDFTSDFGGGTDLHGVHSKVWRVTETSPHGAEIRRVLGGQSLYIADGHHRYHAALLGGQTHLLAYVTDEANILAYDRVIKGVIPFKDVQATLDLEPRDAFATPAKHSFALYADGRAWTLRAQRVPEDVVGRLDCAILERELYPLLGLTHAHVKMPAHFDYYPENALEDMTAAVDAGRYEVAVALHPVAIHELKAVADAGLENPDIVMPEKSTFFSPKILTGLFLYRHTYAG